jgi:hypothetical protein
MNRFFQVLLIGYVTMVFVGCGPTYTQLVERRKTYKSLKRQEEKKDQALIRYASSGSKLGSTPRLLIPTASIKTILKGFHPISARGEKLSKKHIKGMLTFSNPRSVKIMGPEKIRYTTTFSGRNVKVSLKGVPFTGASDERMLRDALTAGATVVVDTKLWVDRKRGAVWLDSDCVELKLKKHNTKRNRDYLKEAINKRIFNIPKVVPLPKALVSKRSYLLVLPDGVMIVNPR